MIVAEQSRRDKETIEVGRISFEELSILKHFSNEELSISFTPWYFSLHYLKPLLDNTKCSLEMLEEVTTLLR